MKIFSQLKGLFLEKLGADPTTEIDEGRLYWDTVNKTAKVYDGSAFNPVGGIDPSVQAHIDSKPNHGSQDTGLVTSNLAVHANTGTVGLTITSSNSYGCTFNASATGDATSITMELGAQTASTSGFVYYAIYATSGGVPTLTRLGETTTVDVDGFPTVSTFRKSITLPLKEPVPLVAGTTYALVPIGDASFVGAAYAYSTLNGYAPGDRYRYFYGSSWSLQSTYLLHFSIDVRDNSGTSLVGIDETKTYNALRKNSSLQRNLEILDGLAIPPYTTKTFAGNPAVNEVTNYRITGSIVGINLSTPTKDGDFIIIKDIDGNNAYNQWYIIGNGTTIDDEANYYMKGPYSEVKLVWNDGQWSVAYEKWQDTYINVATNASVPAKRGSVISVDTVAATAAVITLPANSQGTTVIIKDVKNNAGTNNITVTPKAGESIDGVVGSITISTNGGSVHLKSDGTTWLSI